MVIIQAFSSITVKGLTVMNDVNKKVLNEKSNPPAMLGRIV